MFIVEYAINRMKRGRKGCIALMMLTFSFVLYLCILNNTLEKKEHQLDDIYQNLDVECVVSNLRGTQTDNLYIKDYIVSLFLSDESTFLGKKDVIPFSSYVKNLKFKLNLKYQYLVEGQEVFISNLRDADDLIGLTHLSTDSLIAQESNAITYFENYSKSLFLSDESVCIVSADIFQTLSKDKEGNCYVRLAVGDSAYSEDIFAEQRFKVAGTYEGDNRNIYCPWEIIKALSIKITGMIHTDSLSFSIKNNRQIDIFKELLARYFTNVDITGTLTDYEASNVLTYYEYAITVYDGTLNKTVSSIKDNIKVLEILQPVIIMMSFFIGFLSSFLFVRNRKPEFAVMRSLGTKKGMVFGEAFFEQFFLGIIGTALGLIVYYMSYHFEIRPPWDNIVAFLLCYLLGSGVVIFWIVNVKVMAILKEKE